MMIAACFFVDNDGSVSNTCKQFITNCKKTQNVQCKQDSFAIGITLAWLKENYIHEL